MKQRGFGIPEAVIICVLLLVIGLLGWKYMDVQQNQKNNEDKNHTNSSLKTNKKDRNNTDKASVEDENITVARSMCSNEEYKATDAMAKFSARYVTIEQGKYAHFAGACAESEETAMSGFHAFAYKENGTWTRITAGSGDLACDKLQPKGFSQSMIEACRGPSLE